MKSSSKRARKLKAPDKNKSPTHLCEGRSVPLIDFACHFTISLQLISIDGSCNPALAQTLASCIQTAIHLQQLKETEHLLDLNFLTIFLYSTLIKLPYSTMYRSSGYAFMS